MKKIKLLWLIRTLSKSMAYSSNYAGDELLSSLYLELGELLTDVETQDIDQEEMGFKSNG